MHPNAQPSPRITKKGVGSLFRMRKAASRRGFWFIKEGEWSKWIYGEEIPLLRNLSIKLRFGQKKPPAQIIECPVALVDVGKFC
jgi:hypothetical protein